MSRYKFLFLWYWPSNVIHLEIRRGVFGSGEDPLKTNLQQQKM